MRYLSVIFCLLVVPIPTLTYKILFFIPLATKSHISVFEPLIRALAERGHQLTVVSPTELSKRVPNVTDIVPVTFSQIFRDFQDPFELRRQGTVATFLKLIDFILPASEKIVQSDKFKEIFKQKYDLIFYNGFLDYYFECALLKAQTPSITLTTMATPDFIASYTGNRLPTSFVPLPLLTLPDRMSFSQRLINTVVSHSLSFVGYLDIGPKFRDFNKNYFGDECPSEPGEFLRNASMVFSNSFFALTYPRPALPDMIEIGGMHCRPPQPLLKELDEFLSEAEHGFIYFSFGSVVETDKFPEEYRLKFLSVFSRLKQRVVWKWNSGHMDNLPSNVRVSKWLPQQDILGHPNIRIFITHGGLMSTQEAAYHGVPILGIPIFGDQNLNVKQAENSGFALTMEILDFKEETLEEVLKRLLNESQYRNRAKELSSIFRDQMITPLDRAVYWTEYVMRYKGAPHLRSAARKFNFLQYHSLDVIIIAALAGALSVAVVVFLMWRRFGRSKPTLNQKVSNLKHKKSSKLE